MDIKVKTDNNNKLMQRREIEFYVVSDGPTPSAKEVAEGLCRLLNLNPEHTVITRIDQRFGVRQLTGYAHYYDDEGSMKKYEPAHILERMRKRVSGQPKEAEKAGDAGGEPEPQSERPEESAELEKGHGTETETELQDDGKNEERG